MYARAKNTYSGRARVVVIRYRDGRYIGGRLGRRWQRRWWHEKEASYRLGYKEYEIEKGIRMALSRAYNPPFLPLSCCFSARGRNLLYPLLLSFYTSPLRTASSRAPVSLPLSLCLSPPLPIPPGVTVLPPRGRGKKEGERTKFDATGVDEIQVLHWLPLFLAGARSVSVCAALNTRIVSRRRLVVRVSVRRAAAIYTLFSSLFCIAFYVYLFRKNLRYCVLF